MRKFFLAFGAAVVVYVAGGFLLHYVLLKEGPLQDPYPEVGAVFSNSFERLDQQILREENGQYVRRVTVHPGGSAQPDHIHLTFEEAFQVLEGELVVVLEGREKTITAGQTFIVPPGKTHRSFNPGTAPVTYEIRTTKQHTRYLAQYYGFANEHGSFSAHPVRTLLQLSRFRPDVWAASPSVPAQRALLFVLEPTARLLGYKRFYPQYAPAPVPAVVSQ